MVFENGVKNIQAAAYNGARTVDECPCTSVKSSFWRLDLLDMQDTYKSRSSLEQLII